MEKRISAAKVLLTFSFACFCAWHIVYCCNEAVCASIVSKCMLTQSCKCDLKNASCSRDCFYCLDYLYTECCSCVEMCPKPNDSDTTLSQKSHVEELTEPIPDLFAVLTEEKDRLLRWVSFTYPAHVSLITVNNDKEIKFTSGSDETIGVSMDVEHQGFQVNCTVAFMSQCMSFQKCKNSCRSMGASSYRWFHDGCCQCVGSTCLNYGMNESKCLTCPPSKGDEILIDENAPLGGAMPEYEDNRPKENDLDAKTKIVDDLQKVDSQ